MGEKEYKLELHSKTDDELIGMFNELRKHKCFILLDFEFDIYEELIERGCKRITI